MTTDEIRVKCAKVMGCVEIDPEHLFCKRPRPSDGELSIYPVPDFCSDTSVDWRLLVEWMAERGWTWEVRRQPRSKFYVVFSKFDAESKQINRILYDTESLALAVALCFLKANGVEVEG